GLPLRPSPPLRAVPGGRRLLVRHFFHGSAGMSGRSAKAARTATRRTYTEAQYSTPSAMETIRGWLGPEPGPEDITRVARYMSRTLRIGGMRACLDLIAGAIKEGGGADER
ncbi:MAG: hypothetical protein ACRD1P_07295, partial [Thermoanaerobaculia bacterium]